MKLTSAQNPLIKHFVKLRQDRNYRYAQKSIVVEGIKMLQEVSQNCPVKTLFVCGETASNIIAEQTFVVTEAIMQKVSGTKSPEGVIAEVAMPPWASLDGKNYVVVLDGVNDPGNMGALLRTALALGWEGAFLLEGSCDPYNEKALRAARGATFRLPLATGGWDELNHLIQKNGWLPVAADTEGMPVSELAHSDKILLVLGNEAQGLSKEAHKFCKKTTIPMSGQMESLNVAIAGGILMYILIPG